MEIDKELLVESAQPDYIRHYTYSDYLQWDDDKRRELIDGIPYLMSAPNRKHQSISGKLHIKLAMYLEGKTCKVYYAPFDVRLNADTLDDTVVQPDILVVCDHSKLDDAGCKGAPDMVIEILSPSTSRYDRTLKFKTYLKTGVKEYWIIDPEAERLEANILTNGEYITKIYQETDIAPVTVLKGCEINLAEVFDDN